jgi:hypothetical protein
MTKALIAATAMKMIAATTMSRYEPGISSSSAAIQIISFVDFGTCAAQPHTKRTGHNQRALTG